MAEKEDTPETAPTAETPPKTETATAPAAEAKPAAGEAKAEGAPAASAAKARTPAAGAPRPQGDSRGGDRPPPRGDRGPRDRPRGGGGRPGGRRFFRRKKVDFFSVNKIDDINYKDAQTLKQFIGDRGKILPRRHTGLSAMHQRKLKIAIKRARNIALLPFAGDRDSVTAPRVEKPAEKS